jgi:uncharacterized OB-fold protein
MTEIPQDAITAPWWDATRERRLVLQRCEACRAVQHPPRAVCLTCGGGTLGWQEAAGTGTVDSFTEVARQIRDDLPAPYLVARIRLDEGVVLLSNLVDAPAPACDAPVALTWRPLPDGRALPVFRPA